MDGWKIFSFPSRKKVKASFICRNIGGVAQTGAAHARWYELGKDLDDEMW